MAVIRRRTHNPAHLTPYELKESFVARTDTLAELLRVIREQAAGGPCQHMMLIGPRGMGKTTLGLRFLYAIEDDPDLRNCWQPVAFHEESYGIVSSADFWIHALRHLTRATGEPRWEERAEAITKDEGDLERAAAYALAELMDFSRGSGRRLILFVENLDSVIGQIHDEREIHSLRATLIQRPEILLLGSANAFFEAIGGYGEPLYEFFRVFKLEGIGPEETRRILEAVASSEGRPMVCGALHMDHGRLETIRQLTGGNPRLLGLACRLLIASPLGSVVEDLERLIDEQTPYFKARIEDLPGQSRKVFHCISERWKPLLAKEVAASAKLSSSHASAQLKQLVEKGYVREIKLPHSKRTRYEVGDRFYNIYYLLRFSSSGRDRLERLVGFLHDLFGSAGMRMMYSAALTSLRRHVLETGDVSELLGVLAPRVAADREFPDRDDWRQQAVAIIIDRFGRDSVLVGEIEEAFARCRPHDEVEREWIVRTDELINQGRLADAERTLRKAAERMPQVEVIWLRLTVVSMWQRRFEDALLSIEGAFRNTGERSDTAWGILFCVLKSEALWALNRKKEAFRVVEMVTESPVSDEMTVWVRGALGLAFLTKSVLLIRSEHVADAVPPLMRVLDFIQRDDHPAHRLVAVRAILQASVIFSKLKHDEQAINVRRRLVNYVHVEDSEELRGSVVRGLSENCVWLSERDRFEDVEECCKLIFDYVTSNDSPDIRRLAIVALGGKWLSQSSQWRYDSAVTEWPKVMRYVHDNDPAPLLTTASDTLTLSGRMLIAQERYREADSVFQTATEVSQEHAESWAYRARILFLQADDGRASEAAKFAKRAVDLDPESRIALHALADVLSWRGNWDEGLDRFEQALRLNEGQAKGRAGQEVVDSLIRAAAAGYAARVKTIMHETGLVETMEPLWHAVRAELGEELEALPAEVMDTVALLRRRISGGSIAVGSGEG